MSQMTSTSRVGARALNRPATTTPSLRVVTGAPLRSGGASMGIVCASLLAAGLIGLLLLNTSLAQGSFTLQRLQSTSDQLTDAQDALNASLAASRSPAHLATRAASMGLVPAQFIAFLRLSDGKIIGVAKPTTRGSGFTVVGTVAPPPAKAKAKPASTTPAATARTAPAVTARTAPAVTARTAPAVVAKPASTAPPGVKPAKPAKR